MMRSISKILVYIALIFFIIHLARNDYIQIFHIHSYSLALYSFIFCLSGFLATVYSWKKLLNADSRIINYRDTLAGFGTNIFSKYIPGKIWMMIGPFVHFKSYHNISGNYLMTVSVYTQLLSLCTVTVISSIGVYFLESSLFIKIVTHSLLLITLLWLFADWPMKSIQYFIKKIFKKNFELKRFGTRAKLQLMFWFSIPWILWMIGFFFALQSVLPESVTIRTMYIFPISVFIGIAALFSPGGLGVREAVMVSLFNETGIESEKWVTLALIARVWFVSGEIIIFIIGFTASKLNYNKK